MQFSNRDGAARFLDGSGTPFFVEMIFENGDFSFPLARQVPEEQMRHHRGRGSEFTHHVQGADVWDPLALSFTFRLSTDQPAYRKFRKILNQDLSSAWEVGDVTGPQKTWVTTKGTTTLLAGGPSPALVTTPAFANPRMRAVNVEILFTDPENAGTLHLGYKLGEVEFPPDQQTLQEGDDAVTISCSGRIWGAISEITAFTAGTES